MIFAARSPLVTREGGLLVAVASLSLAAGATLLRPALAATVTLAATCGLAMKLLGARWLLALFLLYLPFEGLLLTHVPTTHVSVVRYAPELLIDAMAAVLIVARASSVTRRLGRYALLLLGVPWIWLITGVANSLEPSTIAVGLRSDLRFAPLAVIIASLDRPQLAAKACAVAVIVGSLAQSVIAGVQLVGGDALRRVLSPKFDIVIDGVSVARSEAFREGVVTGTFAHYNTLGTFLVLGFIALVAYSAHLGVRRLVVVIAGISLVVAIALSGSRESGVALAVAGIVLAKYRFGVRARSLVVAVAMLTALIFVPAISGGVRSAPPAAGSAPLAERWASVVSRASLSADPYTNFRLHYLISNGKEVARDAPLLGYGKGSATDRRLLADGRSSVYRTDAGQFAAKWGYVYDGNWALLILETGFAGIVAVIAAGVAVARLGAAAARLGSPVGTVLVTLVMVLGVLALFAPVFQSRLPSACLWVFFGAAVAFRSQGRRSHRAAP